MTIPFATWHFNHGRDVAVVVISPRTQFAVDHFANGWRSMTTTYNAFPIACCFVDTFKAIPVTRRQFDYGCADKREKIFYNLPIAFGNLYHFRFEAIGVIAFVATIAQQQFVLVLAGRTKLAIL